MDIQKIIRKKMIQRLLAIPSYDGVLNHNNKVVPLWNAGMKEVDLNVFLEGAKQSYKAKKEKGSLYIPLLVPSYFYETAKNGFKENLKELEEKYHIDCVVGKETLEETLREHGYANSFE
jgi:hypothetical protein